MTNQIRRVFESLLIGFANPSSGDLEASKSMATSPGNSNPPISIPRRSISVISSNPYRILTIRRLHLTLRPQVRFTINSPTLRRLSPPSHPRWLRRRNRRRCLPLPPRLTCTRREQYLSPRRLWISCRHVAITIPGRRSWLSSTITTTVEAPPSRPLEIAHSTNIYLCYVVTKLMIKI